MIKNLIKVTLVTIIVQIFISCNSNTKNEDPPTTKVTKMTAYKNGHIMTKAEQDSLTPDHVLETNASIQVMLRNVSTQKQSEKPQLEDNFQKRWC